MEPIPDAGFGEEGNLDAEDIHSQVPHTISMSMDELQSLCQQLIGDTDPAVDAGLTDLTSDPVPIHAVIEVLDSSEESAISSDGNLDASHSSVPDDELVRMEADFDIVIHQPDEDVAADGEDEIVLLVTTQETNANTQEKSSTVSEEDADSSHCFLPDFTGMEQELDYTVTPAQPALPSIGPHELPDDHQANLTAESVSGQQSSLCTIHAVDAGKSASPLPELEDEDMTEIESQAGDNDEVAAGGDKEEEVPVRPDHAIPAQTCEPSCSKSLAPVPSLSATTVTALPLPQSSKRKLPDSQNQTKRRAKKNKSMTNRKTSIETFSVPEESLPGIYERLRIIHSETIPSIPFSSTNTWLTPDIRENLSDMIIFQKDSDEDKMMKEIILRPDSVADVHALVKNVARVFITRNQKSHLISKSFEQMLLLFAHLLIPSDVNYDLTGTIVYSPLRQFFADKQQLKCLSRSESRPKSAKS